MATFKLDGQEIPFEPGDSIIRAAARHGTEIPHYCWHPGLSVAANCRMCLVEIRSGRQMALPILQWNKRKKAFVEGTKPKLAASCQMPAQEGMEVFAKSEIALKAQEATQEFLLLNHPVDCPICDQAGECKLQDYWFTSQHKLKRKRSEPVHKPKAVRFGETIVYDAERCIMCTRCVRFCEEVVGDPVLGMRERGTRNEICVSPGRELDHDYTLMTEHVCPVGALTSRDFRFKSRVWFLRSKPSVCTGCATGCNSWIDFDPRTQEVQRLRPRDNEAVNKHWMCDEGMLSYKSFHEGRVLAPRIVGSASAKGLRPADAIAEAARRLGAVTPSRVALVLSANHSSEDNFVLHRFATEVFGTEQIYVAARAGWKADKILRNADNNANNAGVTLVAGGELPGLDKLAEAIEAGEVEGILSLGGICDLGEAARAPLNHLVVDGTPTVHVNLTANDGPLTDTASVVLPVASIAEASGTFVNAQALAQRFSRAIHAPVGIRPAWQTLLNLAEVMGHTLPFAGLSAIQKAIPSPETVNESGTDAETVTATAPSN